MYPFGGSLKIHPASEFDNTALVNSEISEITNKLEI